MHAAISTTRTGTKLLTWMTGLWLLAGCATSGIDWKARVGNYTYDQAIEELGPPDKSAKLTSGTTVADWLTRRARTVIAPEPYFLTPGSYFGPLTPMRTETHYPARYLRLTFGPDGILKSSRNVGE